MRTWTTTPLLFHIWLMLEVTVVIVVVADALVKQFSLKREVKVHFLSMELYKYRREEITRRFNNTFIKPVCIPK